MHTEMIVTFITYTLLALIFAWGTNQKRVVHVRYFDWRQVFSVPTHTYAAWLLLAFPGLIYSSGVKGVWIIIGLTIGAYLHWQFVAKRLQLFTTETGEPFSLPSFFEHRYHDQSHMLRNTSLLLIVVFSSVLIASGLVAIGKLFEVVVGLNSNTSLWLAFIILIISAWFYWSKTSYVNGVLALLLVVAVPLVTMFKVGNLGPLWNRISQINPDLLDIGKSVTYNYENSFFWLTGSTSISNFAIVSLLGLGLGYFGQPHLLSITAVNRRTGGQKIKSLWVAIIVAISLVAAALSGLFGIALFGQPLEDPEQVLLLMVQGIFSPWFSGILLAIILIVILNTLSSQVMVVSKAVSQDFYHALFRKNASKKEVFWIAKAVIIIVTLIALFIANNGVSVYSLFTFAWAGFGAAFGPAIILSLFWKRTSAIGVFAGLFVGGLTVLAWDKFVAYPIYEMIPGFIFSLLIIIITSLLEKPDRQIQKEFLEVVKNK